MSTLLTSKLSLSEKRSKAARARWDKPGSAERQSDMFKGRSVTWAAKITKSIQELYKDPTYLAKKAKHKLLPLEKACRMRLKTYRFNSKASGRSWELSDIHARQLFMSPCNYCGHVPDHTKLNGIDRVDNSVGYTSINSISCCWVCNRNKGKMTFEEFMDWVDKVHRHLHRVE